MTEITEPKKRGRKEKKESDKVKGYAAYILEKDAQKIIKKFGSITKAVKEKILTEL